MRLEERRDDLDGVIIKNRTARMAQTGLVLDLGSAY
jgi:hypothetical protein